MRAEVDAQFQAALRNSHKMVARVEAWRGTTRLDTTLPDGLQILGGEVKLDATAKVRRQLSLEVPATDAVWDMLSVPGTEVRPYRGIEYPGGAASWVPLGRLEVDTRRIGYAPSGNLSLTAGDYWGRVERSEFLTPGVAEFGTLLTTQVVTFLQGALPSVSVNNQIPETWVIGSKVWETDRAAAITEIVEALGGELFFDALGNAVLRKVPTLAATAVWTVDTGSSGVLMSADRDLTTGDIKNMVIVTPANVDGAAQFDPVYVWDNVSTSPTYAGPNPINNPGGAAPFGIRPARISSALITTTEQATSVGNAELQRRLGVGMRLSITAAVNPGLEPGDTIGLLLPPDPVSGLRSVEAHLIDVVTIPLTPSGTQQITTRSFGATS